MARTIYEHGNSNGATRAIDAAEAVRLLKLYPLAYYSMANNCEGGKGFSIRQDIVGGREVTIVACKLNDGCAAASWLTAMSGSKATGRKIMAEWAAVIVPSDIAVAVTKPAGYRYAPIYRPAGYGALPSGVSWIFIEAPHNLAHIRTDLPRSSYRHGVIETERELTASEVATHELRKI